MTRHEQDKRRERREGRRERRERQHTGPDREAVMEARESAQRALLGDWDKPDVRTLRTLKNAESRPHVLDTDEGRAVLLINYSVVSGAPRHGAKMSRDHVGGLEAELPRECPECGHDRAHLSLSRHHNIAGSWSLTCSRCEREHDGETWG